MIHETLRGCARGSGAMQCARHGDSYRLGQGEGGLIR